MILAAAHVVVEIYCLALVLFLAGVALFAVASRFLPPLPTVPDDVARVWALDRPPAEAVTECVPDWDWQFDRIVGGDL